MDTHSSEYGPLQFEEPNQHRRPSKKICIIIVIVVNIIVAAISISGMSIWIQTLTKGGVTNIPANIMIDPNPEDYPGGVLEIEIGSFINCSLSGCPEPTYSWNCDDGQVIQGQSLLISKSFISEGNRTVMCTCEAANGNQTMAQKDVYFFLSYLVNECDSYPCQNGASCVNFHYKYQCVCSRGFTGTDCEDWTQLNEDCEYFNGKSTSCYHISPGAQTMPASRSYCSDKAMAVCVIETWQEMMYLQSVIVDELNYSKQIWVSLVRSDRYRCRAGDCLDWIYPNGTILPLNYEAEGKAVPWGPNQPNNYGGSQDCAAINYRRFPGISDDGCQINLRVICEKTAQILL